MKENLPELTAPDIDRCVNKYVFDQVFSAAGVVASVGGEIFHRAAYGSPLTPPPLRRIDHSALFDLASLTKPLATALAALWLASRTRLDMGAPLSKTLPEFRDARFDAVTIDMLLDHTAGFPATRRLWETMSDHDALVHPSQAIMRTPAAVELMRKEVAKTPFAYDPGSQCLYSDLGFMVLGWIIESIVGKPLDVYLEREIYRPLGLQDDLFFIRLDEKNAMRRARLKKRVFVATEECDKRDKLMQAEVHDPVAWAMGGVAGHAGLFGTADAVWTLSKLLWAAYKGLDRTFLSGTVRRFWTRSRRVRNTTRTPGWDMPTASQSMAGKRYSRNAVGHLGYTGGSIWIDLNTDVIGVVLTNAIHPSVEGKADAMATFRPRIYDLIAKEGETMGHAGARGAAAFHSNTDKTT